jgi:beta-N-acetylhexosaminidase
LSGLTTLPNQMTLGATWDTELAGRVGQVLGKELSILGINLLLGPSLDVLEAPYSESGGDLGVRTFGGDPFWVGEMGRAYITGLHQGSNNELLVVGKRFPGFGGADRLPEDEAATVRKNLEQLKQFELYPFFAVTGNAPNPDATLDALLTGHIRYQGFQENFRQQTKPISFDREAFSQLMELPALKTWRENGGVMISDSLGSRAVRRFYDPTGQTFLGQVVAVDAFLAGNDILYLNDFISSGDPDEFTSITRTLSFFARKYREDAAFAQRVDNSVQRILAMKYRLYGNAFSFIKTTPSPERNKELNISGKVTFEAAQKAATLISPASSDLDTTIPSPGERIVFLTDTRQYQQCKSCQSIQSIPRDAMLNAVLRLYGTQGGGQIRARDLVAYTFNDLIALLDTAPGELEIETDFLSAEWLVFLTQDIDPASPSSAALRRLLDERPDLVQGKRLVAFAMNAPYFLGATDISKLTAYYGLFSRSAEFIEVATRLLFQEIQPVGDLPVSMPNIDYDLNEVTFPNPSQVIPLFIDMPNGVEATPTPEAGAEPNQLRIGSLVPVRTGVILDHNGHKVPDGTIVYFIVSTSGDTTTSQRVEAQTSQGIARSVLQISTVGNIEIRAESDPATQSDILHFVVPPENATITPSIEAPSTPTLTPSPTVTLTSTPEPTAAAEIPPEPIDMTGFSDWLTSMLIAFAIAVGCYGIGATIGRLRQGTRAALLTIIVATLIYSYLALSMPGAAQYLQKNGSAGVVLLAFLGSLTGATGGWFWKPRKR